MAEEQQTEAYPAATLALQRPDKHKTHNEPQESIVVPLSEHADKFLREETEKLFPPETQEKMAEEITSDIITDTLNRGLPYAEIRPIELGEEKAAALAKQDISERAIDHASLSLAIKGKLAFAEYVAAVVESELSKDPRIEQRRSDVEQVVLETMQSDLQAEIQGLKELDLESQSITPGPLDDLKGIQRTKQIFMYRNHAIAGISAATERVSPEMGRVSNFHRGVLQAELLEKAGHLNERGASVYAREQAGTLGHLLGLNISREFGLPETTASSRKQVEVFTSGMGALGSILESVENLQNAETVITEGVYFELTQTAQIHKTINKSTPVTEDMYFELADKLKKDSSRPLVLFAQPFGSGLEKNVFDVQRTLSIIRSSEGKRPVIFIVDSTMHGATLDKWADVEEITSTGKNFTFVEVQSLVKHGQIGMDTAPAGIALAYGSHPEIIRATAGPRATMIPEHNASILFPFSAETQIHRVQRAGRNAEFIAHTLQESLKDNPLVTQVHYAPDAQPEVAKQYKTTAPILFIELNPLIMDNERSVLIGNFTGLHKIFPETGRGTSYGFDGTRFELIPIGENGAWSLRIAAGQESALPLMAVTNYIEHQFNTRLTEQVSYNVKREISDITQYQPDKDYFKIILNYDPSFNPNNGAESYVQSLSMGPVFEYFNKQCNGHKFVKILETNPKIKDGLSISDESVSKLKQSLDSPEEIKLWIKDWAITQPAFLDRFREKLTIAGKTLSQEKTYQLARAITNHKAIRIILGPVAKIANQVFKDMQEDIEAQLGSQLPFKF